ncbi:hypothetical protein BLJAPNOD_06319 [Ensifer sp. M14]|nr:hypothetical protein BLJAPNOD_06319 [Ensifer sp. M14]
MTITVSAPTIAISPSSLPSATIGTAYSQTISASGGTASYSYAINSGALPAGLTLSPGGTVSGTPTAGGTFNFTLTATDAYGSTGSAAYSVVVGAPVVAFTFAPPGGALSEAMAGEDYKQSISAKGSAGALMYSVLSGALPNGMVLNVSTGELTGPLAVGSEGDYTFTIQVRDTNGSTGTASFTLEVKPQTVTVENQIVNVPAGSSPPNVYLNRGATGGPFASAALLSVEPEYAGTAEIIQGELAQAGPASTPVGWYLRFTPDPAYSGQVRIGYRLTSALGASNTGTITYILAYDPGEVAEDIDRLVHDFVRTRQNLISSSIKVPGLLERRQMEQATNPVTARITPSESGLMGGFSTSIAQLETARDGADGISGGYSSPFNIWIDGAFLAHNDKDVNGGKWGSFAMINLGADYLLSEQALLGLSFHFDRTTDPTDTDAELTGNGWLAGPYASLELGKGVFWNASFLYGGSSNDIDTQFWDGTFDTQRWMADTSIEGQWYLDENTVLTPKLRTVYFSEEVEDYAVKNGAGDTLTIDGFNEEQFRVSLGAEISRSFTLQNGSVVTPTVGVTGGYSGLDGSGAFGSIEAGLSLETAELWMLDLSLLFNIEGEGERSAGARVGASKAF